MDITLYRVQKKL